MPTCPEGHDSASTDFCDVCGMRLDSPVLAPASASAARAPSSAAGVQSSVAPVPSPAAPGPAASPPGGRGQPCPQCGADRPGQFCEACGYSFASGLPAPGAATVAPAQVAQGQAEPAPGYIATVPSQVTEAPGESATTGAAATAEWTAVVTADRSYFDRVIAASGPDAAAVQFPAYCPERRFRLFGPEMRIGRRSPSRGLEPEIDLTGPPTDPGVSHLHAVLISEQDGGWAVFDPGSANGTLVNGREMAAGSRVRLHDGDRICVGAWTMLTIQTD